MKKSISYLFLIGIVYCGCATHEKATKVPVTFDYIIETTQGSPTLINARGYFNSAYQEGAQFKLVTTPAHGKVSIVANGQYFFYEPHQESVQDEFVAEMVSDNGERLASATFRVSAVQPCSRGEVVTYVKISNKTRYTLDLLSNDLFCETKWKNATVFPRESLNAPSGWCFTLTELNSSPTAVFSYTPDPDFTGVSEFFYDMGVNSQQEKDSWRAYMYQNWFYHPEIFEKYVSVRLVVEVTP